MTYVLSDSNRAFIRYVPEANFGVTPSSGNSRITSMTSSSIKTSKKTTISETIRPDRLVQDVIMTAMSSDGSIGVEFSAGALDDYLQAFVMGTWSRPMTQDFVQGTSIAWTGASTLTIATPATNQFSYAPIFVAGRRIKTSSFKTPANNGFFTISSVAYASGTTTITVSASTSVAEAGNVNSRVADANDVVLTSNLIRTGTGGASVIDDGAGTPGLFSSAITAGQLFVGQQIHIDGLGYATATVTFASVPATGATVTISDGTNSYAFTAGTDFAPGASVTTAATALAAAINSSRCVGISSATQTALTYVQVTATSAAGVVTLTNVSNVTPTTGTVSVSGADISSTAFTGGDATVRGIFTITSLNNDQLFVTPAPNLNANSGSMSVILRASTLVNPLAASITPQSFVLQTSYADVSAYSMTNGQRVSTISLDVASGAIVKGEVAFMGTKVTTGVVDVLGTAPFVALPAQGNTIVNATVDVGQLLVSGNPVSTAVKSIKVDAKAMLRQQEAVGALFPIGIGTGRQEISISAEAYFATWTEYQDFLTHTQLSLYFTISDPLGLTYAFTFPALRLTEDDVSITSANSDIMQKLKFEAFIDPATKTMMQVGRFSSLLPVGA